MPASVPAWESLDLSGRAPRKAPSLADQAYEALKQWVVDGDLPAGVPLSENDLARRFSISRSPLREAVRRLQDEGLLEPSGPRGFSVPPLSVELVREVYGVRRALETAAAETAVAIPPADIRSMRERLDDQVARARQGDFAPFNENDFAFHDLFVANCGNRLLISHLHRLRGSLQRIINYAGRFEAHTMASCDEHLAIMAAMEAGSTAELRHTVDVHIRGVTERLVATFEANGG
ncbi:MULTISPECIES: GntR family transcriptional regulator [Pseudonocardia]|jgi:DNA-binding GntR family transcriptional regulator|uniref:Transcriptional regulator, GntR family n=2 Tax=Pseudonocardia dioxanivorans TaxID=240495 RepID=F4CPG2_PSEUX|nr:GntR family transcriptional regulator [Pseudonocardia dioxanivorans]AEA24460.1 transcriptional regulator, GntR family [Pseudonocardia dioxanivorans CB1190]GJF01133.1 GntR family transcriptional regulator [Pseudonocardia sp. D17]